MTLDASTLSLSVIALGAAVIALAIWVALLQRAEARLRLRLRRVFDGGNEGLDEALDRMTRRGDDLGARLEAINSLHRELSAVTRRTVQKVGLVRFNPFQDTGGDQSFAIALLDADGNGVVISSLHSRTDTRIFAKEVTGGRSRHQLSDEEQAAIRQALVPAP